ncbi:DUF1351 domain-containing protein [Eggerthellaceae bacterium zg-893]|nr:DUF1351 domain-containing protein [Eggerthellaceae bacterium zg-893]
MRYEDMKAADLRSECARRGIGMPAKATKATMAAALAEDDAAHPEVARAEVIEPPVDGLVLSVVPCEISANFDALEARVDGILSRYDGWEPSADSGGDLEAIKCEKRLLKDLYDQIEVRRKAAKNEAMAPINAMDARASGIAGKVKAVRDRLVAVEKEAEDWRKGEKKALLREHYEAFAGAIAELVPYDKIHDERWLNKGVPMPKAEEELEARVEAVAEGWERIKGKGLEFQDAAEARFFETLDCAGAVEWAEKLARDRRKIEELKELADPGPGRDPGATERPGPRPAPAPARAPDPDPAPVPFAPPAHDPEALADMLVAAAGAKGALRLAMERVPVSFPGDGAAVPRVMAIESATVEQATRIGAAAGAVGVTGRFMRGTVEEVCQRLSRERMEAAHGQ